MKDMTIAAASSKRLAAIPIEPDGFRGRGWGAAITAIYRLAQEVEVESPASSDSSVNLYFVDGSSLHIDSPRQYSFPARWADTTGDDAPVWMGRSGSGEGSDPNERRWAVLQDCLLDETLFPTWDNGCDIVAALNI